MTRIQYTPKIYTERFRPRVSDHLRSNKFSRLTNCPPPPIGTYAFDQDLAGTAYFDNYVVYQTTVKIFEPLTITMGLAALLLVVGVGRWRD